MNIPDSLHRLLERMTRAREHSRPATTQMEKPVDTGDQTILGKSQRSTNPFHPHRKFHVIRNTETGKVIAKVLNVREWVKQQAAAGRSFYYIDLSGQNLSGIDLSKTNLSEANLSGANLSETNLSGANLSKANLNEANLSGANLTKARLVRATLERANLGGADLSEANLSMANLREATLNGAILSDADLRGADLRGATYDDTTRRDWKTADGALFGFPQQ